jgi:hypothetical protein
VDFWGSELIALRVEDEVGCSLVVAHGGGRVKCALSMLVSETGDSKCGPSLDDGLVEVD